MTVPVTCVHNGVQVIRDDLFPGGTKARFLGHLFRGADELVYASPAEGGAQTALAAVAQQQGKRATIFVARRKQPHPRALMAKRLGATIYQVRPGYLSVVQARAKEYCRRTGAVLAPFGVDMPEAIDTIAAAAASTGLEPDEVWCACGSGVLARSLAKAWPEARLRVVQVGRDVRPDEVAGAEVFSAGMPFSKADDYPVPFPSCPHYDAKAWRICQQQKGAGNVVFWNVTGPAEP